ncbi:Alkaline phosphatase synthesis sensor protein PhoR [compost metagenome]
MLNSTRRRLVILNAAVFLFVLAVLSTILYFHMQYRLLHDTDEILNEAKARIQSLHDPSQQLKSNELDPEQDDKITYLFWDAQGQLVRQLPQKSFTPDVARQFSVSLNVQAFRTLAVNGSHYRVLQLPYQENGTSPVVSITLIRSTKDVQRTLDALMWDLGAGIAVGAGIFVFAGLFLAGRALIPIRKSWDKQQRFVADASHELRTPTAIIQAQTELLLRHPGDSIEQMSPDIAVILKESKRMSKLLEDLLTLARSDSNQLQIQPTLFQLNALIRELTRQFSLLANTKEIDIEVELQEPLSLWGDESRIRQLLVILLDNALKYTPESGVIKVSGRYQSNQVYICVSDSGCGIAENELPYIFDRFYRGDKVRSRTEGGTGLGLSIAKWIVEVHGGDIHIHSRVGDGTRIELLFPRKKSVTKP